MLVYASIVYGVRLILMCFVGWWLFFTFLSYIWVHVLIQKGRFSMTLSLWTYSIYNTIAVLSLLILKQLEWPPSHSHMPMLLMLFY